METRDHDNSTLVFLPEESTLLPKDELRERIKIEFYKTYDVMTGIRIAATLGGFFSMMILLVLYKNYCKPSKTLSEEQLNAAVTAAAEEEDRALQAALEATSFYTSLEKRRQSLENTNQVLLSPRFSSVGGGYSHLTPPLKISVMQQRGKSLPGSVLQFGSGGSPFPIQKNGKTKYLTQEEDFDCHPLDFIACKNHMNILPSRRVSSVTCSSADSFYLERRCSAFEIGLPGPPHFVRRSREKLLGKKEEPWDFYYPIDIQVIQPTPEVSPTSSERNINEDFSISGLKVPGIHDQMHTLSVANFDIGLAPLASISSLGSCSQSSSITAKSFASSSFPPDNQLTNIDDSLGSDSVFVDIDELATDSELEYDGFNDDYSFCELQERPPGRLGTRTLASFDSNDGSIGQDALEEIEETTDRIQPKPKSPTLSSVCRNCSGDLKRRPSLNEESREKRKLVKTYSEPRNDKVPKHLPAWSEKGKSGYVPRRQMSSPSKKRRIPDKKKPDQANESVGTSEDPTLIKSKLNSSQEVENAKDLTKCLLPPSNSSSSDSVTLIRTQSTSTPLQTLKNDLPSRIQEHKTKQLSLLTTQEKRSRLQKQKNFAEEVKPSNKTNEKTKTKRLTDAEEPTKKSLTSSGLLRPPNMGLSASCEKLSNINLPEDLPDIPDFQINLGSSTDHPKET